MVEFDTLILAIFRDIGRHHAQEVAHAHAWFEDVSAFEAHGGDRIPHGADDVFRRVVGILGGARRRAVFFRGQQFLEVAADILKPGAILALAIFEGARQAAPADILGKDGLLFPRGRAVFLDQALGEADGGEVVSRLGFRAAALGYCTGLNREIDAFDRIIRSSGGSGC